MTIETPSDWWACVDRYWPQLRAILYRFIPMDKNEGYDGEILLFPLSKHIEELKEQRNQDLARYFNAAWGAAPDDPSIHRIPGWGMLCDLCSEEWVFNEPPEVCPQCGADLDKTRYSGISCSK